MQPTRKLQMNQKWSIDAAAIAKVKQFVAQQMANPFVQERCRRNLQGDKTSAEKHDVWKQMAICLLTTRQRSGPDAPVSHLALEEPFPLAYATCVAQGDVRGYAHKVLTERRGIRFTYKIPDFLAKNLEKLELGFWQETMMALDHLRLHQNQPTERKVAAFIRKEFRGFGPKQSRNLLQCLGFTRYEIPIDSRASQKLAELGFPVQFPLVAERAYCRVLDDIQILCEEADVLPCVLDAAIFVSGKDGQGWTENNVKLVF